MDAKRLPLPPIPDPHAARMYRVVRTARTMLRKCGFTPRGPDLTEPAFWLRHGSLLNRHSLTVLGDAADGSGELMAVFFPPQPSVDVVRTYVELLREHRVRHCIVVVAHGAKRTSQVRYFALEQQQQGFPLELMLERQLYSDPTASMMVPLHVRLREEEAAVLLREVVRQPPAALPTMLTTDPVAQFLRLRHGDIVKVVSASAAVGVSVEYRRVVAGVDRSQGEERKPKHKA